MECKAKECKANKAVCVILTVLFIIALLALIITASIGLPIYMRFFYYLQIKPLGLEEASGHTYKEIVEAYNLLLDYLTLPGKTFSTGVFAYTEDEIAHFDDCKFLFNLNLWVMLSSAATVTTLGLLQRFKVIRMSRPWGRSSSLISVILSILLPLIVVLMIFAVGWDDFYELFHHILFPGKDNWYFNPRTEQIINVLPDEFFLNCGILIGCGIVGADIGFVIYDVVSVKKRRAATSGTASSGTASSGDSENTSSDDFDDEVDAATETATMDAALYMTCDATDMRRDIQRDI